MDARKIVTEKREEENVSVLRRICRRLRVKIRSKNSQYLFNINEFSIDFSEKVMS